MDKETTKDKDSTHQSDTQVATEIETKNVTNKEQKDVTTVTSNFVTREDFDIMINATVLQLKMQLNYWVNK